MSGDLFVLKDGGTLVGMQPASFASEDDFQRMLAQFPALLAGGQINAALPRRWVLVAREKAVTDDAGGAARWSLDHLFLDQDGVPTLVEVKLKTNTQLRREVVGQMLEYAANAVALWSAEEIRASFNATCAASDAEPDEAILRLIGPDGNPEQFWQAVKTNLQAGRIRMLFVADLIPSELRRIVEFLNAQMNPAEVLALELRQFEGEGMRTIVPLVYGQSEAATVKKASPGEKRRWDTDSFYADLAQRAGPGAAEAARKIEGWMRETTDQVRFGVGQHIGSITSIVSANGSKFYPCTLWSNGITEMILNYNSKPPFDDPALRLEWARRIAASAQVELGENPTNVGVPLQVLADDARRAGFLEALNWGVSQMRRGVAPAAGGPA